MKRHLVQILSGLYIFFFYLTLQKTRTFGLAIITGDQGNN